jgi:hypothetical protein
MEEVGQDRLEEVTSPMMDRTSESPRREIKISPLDYGYIVKVGCQSLAIESKYDLIKYLSEYLVNSSEAESKYYNKVLLKHQ